MEVAVELGRGPAMWPRRAEPSLPPKMMSPLSFGCRSLGQLRRVELLDQVQICRDESLVVADVPQLTIFHP